MTIVTDYDFAKAFVGRNSFAMDHDGNAITFDLESVSGNILTTSEPIAINGPCHFTLDAVGIYGTKSSMVSTTLLASFGLGPLGCNDNQNNIDCQILKTSAGCQPKSAQRGTGGMSNVNWDTCKLQCKFNSKCVGASWGGNYETSDAAAKENCWFYYGYIHELGCAYDRSAYIKTSSF